MSSEGMDVFSTVRYSPESSNFFASVLPGVDALDSFLVSSDWELEASAAHFSFPNAIKDDVCRLCFVQMMVFPVKDSYIILLLEDGFIVISCHINRVF